MSQAPSIYFFSK